MINIPLNKVIAPVIDCSYEICVGCYFEPSMKENALEKALSDCKNIACNAVNRKDGMNVIFKLIDWPVEEKR